MSPPGLYLTDNPYTMRNDARFILTGLIILIFLIFHAENLSASDLITNRQDVYKPLDQIELSGLQAGTVIVLDGKGKEYVREAVHGSLKFRIGGFLGSHAIIHLDQKGRLLGTESFKVDASTMIRDESGEFSDLMDILHYSMIKNGELGRFVRFNGQVYQIFYGWLQDNVHSMKALKYFYPEMTSFMDFFAAGQREDGMMPDFFHTNLANLKHYTLRYGPEFIHAADDDQSSGFFIKVIVENMSEFHFLEGLYFAWKATGDDRWMSEKLDKAIRIIEYMTSDPYRWSEKFQLTKRPYTIDIWDFLPDEEAERFHHNTTWGHPGQSEYGILYADNIGLAQGCDYVSEMLHHAGRNEEAARIKAVGERIRERTEALCWNGQFYTHWMPEDPAYTYDFGGTDISRQISLSNAYVLNKGICHDNCVRIIRSYQSIRNEMPGSSPGEWYMIYPPYEKGWHIDKWEYMNGGVSPIVAGELAHGAFEHGFEEYAVDILRRVHRLAKKSGDYLHCVYRGAMPEVPERKFITVDLRSAANADFSGEGTTGVAGWIGEGKDDISHMPVGRQVFEDVPFEIIAPETNGRRACIGLSGDPGYLARASVMVNSKAASVYLLHVMHDPRFTISHTPEPRGKYYAGSVVLHYRDGSSWTHPVTNDQTGYFHYPRSRSRYEWPRRNTMPLYKVAWKGENSVINDVGIYIYGFDNPHPDREISSMELIGANTPVKWMVAGITLTDAPLFFMPSEVSFGAPDAWSAAAVAYAMVEGLAGVKDAGVAFNHAVIAPRWLVAGVDEASATIKYEASGGYVSYTYRFDRDEDELDLAFTGTQDIAGVRFWIPQEMEAAEILGDGKPVGYRMQTVENSRYACFEIKGCGVHDIKMKLK
jgi:hypothetical protein